MKNISDINYFLKCIYCGKTFEDNGTLLSCDENHDPSFLRTVYSKHNLSLTDRSGIYKFSEWLPINKELLGSSSPITFKSKELSDYLKLDNLYITFNGYWPEKNSYMSTCSFKECEAFTVCSRLPVGFKDTLVVASTGNTARAFARVCSDNNIKLLLIVPNDLKNMLWFNNELKSNVKLITIDGDYFDAIQLADYISTTDGFINEGGSKNVARRDGMGTTVMSFVSTIGKIPDFYFQAIGSGAGAIAAWEQNNRFVESGHYGDNKMKIIISQNYPFTPIIDSWNKKSKTLIMDENKVKENISKAKAKVLTNRNPAYSITGGIYDVLTESQGHALSITNKEAKEASNIFESKEGIDVFYPSAISIASLIKSISLGLVNKKDIIMLNITGGGVKKFKKEYKLNYLKPSLLINNGTHKEQLKNIKLLFK